MAAVEWKNSDIGKVTFSRAAGKWYVSIVHHDSLFDSNFLCDEDEDVLELVTQAMGKVRYRAEGVPISDQCAEGKGTPSGLCAQGHGLGDYAKQMRNA